jgi:MFS family permease
MTTLSFNEQKSSSSTDDHKDTKFSRHALSVFASLYTFVFVGALFGWGPMQRLLESSGAFSYMCSSTAADDGEPCTQQSQTIINIGFMAICLSIVTPIIGSAIDDYGAPTVSFFMGFCGLSGSGLLVVAAAFQIDWLYWVCFALLGLTTFTGSLLSVQVGLFFIGRTQVRIIMWLNTLFDAGSVSYLFLWIVQEAFDLSFVMVAVIYFLLAVLLFVPASYLWTVAEPEMEGEPFKPDEADPLHRETAADDIAQSETTGSVTESLRLFMESKMDYTLLTEVVSSRHGNLGSSVRDTAGAHIPPSYIYGSIREEQTSMMDDEGDYVLLSEKSAKDQLLSMPFIMLNFFFSVSQISCNWSLITAADFLASLGDDGWYLKLFTLMQPASILALPLVDWLVNHYGFGAAFQAVNVINFVYILIKCTSTNLHLHVVTFFMVAAVRCFLYATSFSFLPSLLSADVVGRGTGFLYMIGGLASFLNIPLNFLASGGDFLTPNLIYLFAVFPCAYATWYVQKTISREAEIRASRENGGVTKVGKL